MEKKYSYERFGSSSTRVGQAVYDILSTEQPTYTAEEIIEGMGKGVFEYIQSAAEEGYKTFDSNFYIIHIFKKTLGHHGIENTMSQKAVCFVEGPTDSLFYMKELPNATKTLYEVDRKNGIVKLMWTVPGWEDCKSILKAPQLYDEKLVEWTRKVVEECKAS